MKISKRSKEILEGKGNLDFWERAEKYKKLTSTKLNKKRVQMSPSFRPKLGRKTQKLASKHNKFGYLEKTRKPNKSKKKEWK